MNAPLPYRLLAGPVSVGCLAVLFCLHSPPPLEAARPVTPVVATAGVAFADSDRWEVRRLYQSTNNRTRVVQIAVLCMIAGLCILMKK